MTATPAPSKSRGTLVPDLIAGLTTGVANIPDAMASSILAGVNPVQGLYAVMVGTPLGAFLGSSAFMNVYTMKMAGVFMITTCTLSLRTGIIPRWMAYLGLALALFLLFSLGFFDWAPLVFPLWVLLISVHILLANLRRPQSANTTATPKG